MSRTSLRLLHTSDVHIDGFGVAARDAPHGETCVCPLLAIEDLANRHDVDGVIVAGDLFDHARITEQGFKRVYEVLNRLPGQCIVMVGNHDVHDDRSLYHRHGEVVDATSIVLFDQLEGNTEKLFDGTVHVWGKAMDEHSPAFRPLAGIGPRPDDDVWFLALAHGHYVGDETDSHRSSLITAKDIAATNADYVALGHWHLTTDVSQGPVTAWYSGAPSGRPGGNVLLVDLDPDAGVTVSALEVALPNGCA